MNITINGKQQRIEEERPSLHDIVHQFCRQSQRVIAEVNGKIVKNPRWDEVRIQDGDTIELVSFVGGG